MIATRNHNELDGVDALEPTDREIVRLVAEGLANRDIGARVFLSVKTIENRLSRIYSQMGVRSRFELAWRARDWNVGSGADRDVVRPGGALTDRERQIASLVAMGWTNRRVAEHLQISVRTVENHLVSCFRRLGISSRSELAVRRGW